MNVGNMLLNIHLFFLKKSLFSIAIKNFHPCWCFNGNMKVLLV